VVRIRSSCPTKIGFSSAIGVMSTVLPCRCFLEMEKAY
jgi:hypothetical protein